MTRSLHICDLPRVCHTVPMHLVQSILAVDPVVWFPEVFPQLGRLTNRISKFYRWKHFWSWQLVFFHQVFIQVSSFHYDLRLLNLWNSQRIQRRPWTVLGLNCSNIVKMFDYFLPDWLISFRIEFEWFDDFSSKVLFFALFLSNFFERVKLILRALDWQRSWMFEMERFAMDKLLKGPCPDIDVLFMSDIIVVKGDFERRRMLRRAFDVEFSLSWKIWIVRSLNILQGLGMMGAGRYDAVNASIFRRVSGYLEEHGKGSVRMLVLLNIKFKFNSFYLVTGILKWQCGS